MKMSDISDSNNIKIYNEKYHIYNKYILFKYISFVLNLIMCLPLLDINREQNIELLNSPEVDGMVQFVSDGGEGAVGDEAWDGVPQLTESRHHFSRVFQLTTPAN